MKGTLAGLGCLVLLLLVSAAVLSIGMLRPGAIPIVRPVETAPVRTSGVVDVEILEAPAAILVLDVSASMKTSDSAHLQTEAVIRFFDIFADLSTEMSPSGGARIAIVLFATGAQVIDWLEGDANDPWLAVERENSRLFEETIEHYLGLTGEDPRLGLRTDYHAALLEVDRLTKSLPSPPLVIFMTDGRSDPNPLMTPSLSDAVKERRFGETYRQVRPLLRELEEGRHRFLQPVRDGSGGTILDREHRGALRVADIPEDLDREVLDAVRAELASILDRHRWRLSKSSGAIPAFWAPVYLGPAGAAPLAGVRDVLVPEPLSGADYWRWDRGFIHCRRPESLTSEFIGLLAPWLRLPEQVIDSGTALHIPEETDAFAVVVELEGDASEARLARDDVQVRLAGRDRVWAGVGRGGGKWRLETSTPISKARVYLRPRYAWALRAPEFVRSGDRDARMKLALSLFSLEERAPVRASDVFDRLPESLEAEYLFRPGGQRSALVFRPVRDADGGSPGYEADVPLLTLGKGELHVRVQLSPLEQLGLPVFNDPLERVIQVRPSVRLVLQNVEGEETGLYVGGYPLPRATLQERWEKVAGPEDR